MGVIFESFLSNFDLQGALGALLGSLGRSWGHPVRFWSNVGTMWAQFWTHFGSFLAPFWRLVLIVFSRRFLDRFWLDFGSILEPKWTHFGAKKCSESERVTFQKHVFSLSKTYVFELGASPEHQKNESGSDAETKLNF